MEAPVVTVGYNVDHEIAFVRGLGTYSYSCRLPRLRLLLNYRVALNKRAQGFKGNPLNEADRQQILQVVDRCIILEQSPKLHPETRQ
jgi:hypothetical protein